MNCADPNATFFPLSLLAETTHGETYRNTERLAEILGDATQRPAPTCTILLVHLLTRLPLG